MKVNDDRAGPEVETSSPETQETDACATAEACEGRGRGLQAEAEACEQRQRLASRGRGVRAEAEACEQRQRRASRGRGLRAEVCLISIYCACIFYLSNGSSLYTGNTDIIILKKRP